MHSAIIASVVFLFLAEEAPPQPADPRHLELPAWTAKEASPAVTAWRAAAKQDDRVPALRELVKGRHPDITRELAALLKDTDLKIRQEAAVLLGTQRGNKEAGRALLPLLKVAKGFDLVTTAEAVRSLGHVGYDAKGRKLLDELFFGKPDPKLRQAVIQAIGISKDKDLVSLLVAVIDQPKPEDPANPANPPASFWKDKYDEWIVFKDDAIAALEAITGKRFYNSHSAMEWIEAEGKKLGIRYERGRNPWR